MIRKLIFEKDDSCYSPFRMVNVKYNGRYTTLDFPMLESEIIELINKRIKFDFLNYIDLKEYLETPCVNVGETVIEVDIDETSPKHVFFIERLYNRDLR